SILPLPPPTPLFPYTTLFRSIKGTTPYCVKTVAVLNAWGKARSWGCHMVHHALYQKQNYSYAGIIEALSGAPFDVKFISFDDVRSEEHTSELQSRFDLVCRLL